MTTTKTNTDIDLVWNLLKNEDGTSSSSSFTTQTLTKKQHQRANPNQNITHRARFDIVKEVGKVFDIDTVCTEELQTVHHDRNDTDIEVSSAAADLILCGLDDDVNETAIVQSQQYDSDDDDDDDQDEENDPSAHQHSLDTVSWRIERVSNALRSDDVSTRVDSLTKLNDAINTLLLHCQVSPDMNHPPPYDDTSTDHNKVNRNVPMVSDLARPRLRFKVSTNSDTTTTGPLSTSTNQDETKITHRLQAMLNACGNTLFRLLGDSKSEKCRSISLKCIQSLLLATGIDIGRHIPYLVPALCARYPQCAYDKDMEIFVQDHQMHELYKRGGATSRQDRASHIGMMFVEPNEELRLELCQTFTCLMRGIVAANAERSLDAYYADIILSLQTSLSDPFPEVRIEASRLLVQLLRIPHYEQGAKYFATGLARSTLANCRHRNTNVIIAALDLFEASVCVPDRAKVKGAGTAALTDLVGFREENVSV